MANANSMESVYQRTPLISVLIVNYNGARLLKECLDSLEVQTFRDFEIVMVDNASKDNSVAFVQQYYPKVNVVVSESNLGFGGGNNLGYQHCRGEFIYFLNNDVFAEKDALNELVSEIRKNPSIHIFASFLIQYRDRTKVDSAGDTLYTCGKGCTFVNYPVSLFTKPRLITAACGGAALFSRSTLEKIGLFDVDYFLNYEDLDLSFRAQHMGEKILFVPSSKIYHYGSASQGGRMSPMSLFYAERNFGLFVLKNFPLPFLITFAPAIFFVKSWGFLKAIWARCPMAFIRGNLSFLGLLTKIPTKRRAILSTSILSNREFKDLFRKNWLREKIAYLRGKYDIPL
jgi:hypothetical protein